MVVGLRVGEDVDCLVAAAHIKSIEERRREAQSLSFSPENSNRRCSPMWSFRILSTASEYGVVVMVSRKEEPLQSSVDVLHFSLAEFLLFDVESCLVQEVGMKRSASTMQI